VRAVADSHIIYWYVHQSERLSNKALQYLGDAEADEGIIVSAVTIPELWMAMTRKRSNRAVQSAGYTLVRGLLEDPTTAVSVVPLDQSLWRHFETAAALLPDPFDAFIVATALELDTPLITADTAIAKTGIVEVVW
jgi:PIN domain nuclease of toxin-antitoxin system